MRRVSWLEIAGVVGGALALARLGFGLTWLARWVRAADIRRMPKDAGPPVSVLVPLEAGAPALRENLVALLRQNHPAFEVLFAAPGAGDATLADAGHAARAVPDVPVRVVVGASDGATPLDRARVEARHGRLVAVDASVRADPLFLRDVARGLDGAGAVAFLPVLFGMRTTGARLAALLADTDLLVTLGLAGGRVAPRAAIGARAEALEPGRWRFAGARVALAARAARVHAPGGAPGATARLVVDVARAARAGAPWTYLLLGAPAFAPAIGLALLVAGPARGVAAAALGLQLVLRAAVAVVVDLRFCWDRSLVRALPLLPLLWLFEPAAWLAGWTGRAARPRVGLPSGA